MLFLVGSVQTTTKNQEKLSGFNISKRFQGKLKTTQSVQHIERKILTVVASI